MDSTTAHPALCYTYPMITTYILAGGNDRASEDYGKRLAQEITKYAAKPKILSCFFASPAETWQAKASDWKTWFSGCFGANFTYDYAQKDTFLDQIDLSDVIYLHGGITQLLLSALPYADELKAHFKGKIIVGSSAGANLLSKKYWSSTKAEPGNGLGLVDINTMVHYGSPDMEGISRTLDDWKKEEIQFQKFVGSGDITHLPEGQFVVVQV